MRRDHLQLEYFQLTESIESKLMCCAVVEDLEVQYGLKNVRLDYHGVICLTNSHGHNLILPTNVCFG